MSEQTEGQSWIKRHIPLTILIVVLGTSALISLIGNASSAANDRRQAQQTPEMIKAELELAAKQQAQAQVDQKAWDASKAGKVCKAHPDWSHPICELIATEKVSIGITDEQARASWGTPDDINRTTTSRGTHEQWVYGSNYLYFEDGVLTSIQN